MNARSRPTLCRPVNFSVGASANGDREKSIESGVSDYLAKPLDSLFSLRRTHERRPRKTLGASAAV
jgi:hypothetical protein